MKAPNENSEITSKVAVLLPVYNAEKYLAEAIESILNQTYSDFCFYIINDGSTDGSEEIILSYKDKRINYIKNESNSGLIYTLNRGFELIKAMYIVRMDADDISMPERIERQVAYMDNNPDIWVLGTQVHFFGNSDSISKLPLHHKNIHAQLLFISNLAHPSVIIRQAKFTEHLIRYDPYFAHVEDYELWARIGNIAKFANLPEILYRYRNSGENISVINHETRTVPAKKIYMALLTQLGIDANDETLNVHYDLLCNSKKLMNTLIRVKKHKDKLIVQNKFKNIYDQEALEENLNIFWKNLFFKIVPNGILEIINYLLISKSLSFSQIRYVLGYYKAKFK